MSSSNSSSSSTPPEEDTPTRRPPEIDQFVDHFLALMCDRSRRQILELLAVPPNNEDSTLPERRSTDIAKELGIDEHKLRLLSDQSSMIQKLVTFTKKDFAKYRKTIDLMTESALKNMKTISFEIGPNYLHDILDFV